MMKVYNTLTRQKENFEPIKDRKVNMFVCGPTVYDFAHLGHAKTTVQFDVIVKYLRMQGFKVFYLQNITDIDDRIIKRAEDRKTDWKSIAREFEKKYIEDMNSLGVDSVDKYARATRYIPEIISQVQRLIDLGAAYKISDGYYFDLKKFKDYGKLAKRTEIAPEDAISRIDENKEKRNSGDFCLWKFRKGNDPFWKTELGEGRPGWHIEDTAITEKELGPQYDLHGGGVDLIFPHHEAEIAQMESISGKKPLVRYWMHTGFVRVNKEKMSKSLGNFFTIREALEKYSPKVLRFLFISSHYRQPIELSEDLLESAKGALRRINESVINLESYLGRKSNPAIKRILAKAEEDFEDAMNDDFETANALAAIFKLVKEANVLMSEGNISKSDAKSVLKTLKKFDKVFGIIDGKTKAPKEIKELMRKREAARQAKDWQLSDDIREELKQKGWTIDDTPEGSRARKL